MSEASLIGDVCILWALILLTSVVGNLLKDKWLSNPAVNPTVTFLRKLFTVSGIQNTEIFMKTDRCYHFLVTAKTARPIHFSKESQGRHFLRKL